MERCHSRSMEHFRRLGIADAVRKVGYPEDLPLDAFLVRSLAEPAIAQLQVPSVVEARKQSEQANDGRFPAEPYQIVSQYALEPLLKSVAENVRRDRAVWLRTPLIRGARRQGRSPGQIFGRPRGIDNELISGRL